MRRLFQEMPQHKSRLRRMRGFLPNTKPRYHMNELTPEFYLTISLSLHSKPLIS